MEDKKYVKALDIKEMEHIEPGHTIKLYGEETTVQAFYAAYNEGLGRWETIILTDGRGDPFERSLDVIEVLPDQPWNHPLPPGATILPTNEQVSTWFEENIDKECSASSAIYKFRQWLKSLPAEPKRGPVWVKDRMPDSPDDYYCKCKVDGEPKKLIVEFDKNGRWGEVANYDWYEDLEILEWLDEQK